MTDDGQAFLTSLQLSDSFLPVGSYTSSYGLESFIREDVVETPAELGSVLEDYLRYLVGPCDMVALSAVHEASAAPALERIVDVDVRYGSMQLAKEFRESSLKSGRQLLELMVETEDIDLLSTYEAAIDSGDASGHYPIVLGIVSRDRGLTPRQTCFVYGHSFVTGMLGAAQRLIGLSHTDVQRLLGELQPAISNAWEENRSRGVSEMQTFSPFVEIMGMKHERSEVRLFVS